eukprot:jgi/Mesen1/8861/ME000053S08256
MTTVVAADALSQIVGVANSLFASQTQNSKQLSSPSSVLSRKRTIRAGHLSGRFPTLVYGKASKRSFQGLIVSATGEETSPIEYDKELVGKDDTYAEEYDNELTGGDANNGRAFAADFQDASQDILKDVSESVSGVGELKRALLDTLYGTERGSKASSETRAEVLELVSQLESSNPTAAPTEDLTTLGGKWILVFTSFSELYPLLTLNNLPLVKVGEISQEINIATSRLVNTVSFSSPIASRTFSAAAEFEIRSDKRLQVKFTESVISQPTLVDDPSVPDSVDFFGQRLSLSPVEPLLRPLKDAAVSVVNFLSGQPPIKFDVGSRGAASWLLTTYLDEDLRISRGDGGGVFVLVKEGSPLSYYY